MQSCVIHQNDIMSSFPTTACDPWRLRRRTCVYQVTSSKGISCRFFHTCFVINNLHEYISLCIKHYFFPKEIYHYHLHHLQTIVNNHAFLNYLLYHHLQQLLKGRGDMLLIWYPTKWAWILFSNSNLVELSALACGTSRPSLLCSHSWPKFWFQIQITAICWTII